MILLKKVQYESGNFGWFGMIDDFIIPAHPNQTKKYVKTKIKEYLNGKAKYFRM